MHTHIVCIVILININTAFTLQSGKAINNNTAREFDSPSSPSKLLSRRKRFLVFPEGSSVQLVFCTQNHGYLQIGDVVWFGNTAALAWELPSDPEVLSVFNDRKHLYDNRRTDSSKHKIIYVDENGTFTGEVSYRRRPIVNPAFAKRSIEKYGLKSNNTNTAKAIKKMHKQAKAKDFYKRLDNKKKKVDIKTRKDLLAKIEKLLEGIGLNGKECVLRLLCETGKRRSGQGSFLEELLRATFALPGGRGFDSVNTEYDIAHGTNGECATLYVCEHII